MDRARHPDDVEWDEALEEFERPLHEFDAAIAERDRLEEKGGLTQLENAEMLRPADSDRSLDNA